MIRILRFLWTGDWHLHEWETKEESNLFSSGYQRPVGRRAYCRCKHCGRWKMFEMY